MSRSIILILSLAVFLLTVACSNRTAPSPTNSSTRSATPDPFASTRAVFAKHCQNCHKANGDGGSAKAEDGTKLKVPSLREGHALHHPDSDFQKQITKGGDGMPAFADKLNADQINDLVKFIRHEFQPGVMPPTDSSPMKDTKK